MLELRVLELRECLEFDVASVLDTGLDLPFSAGTSSLTGPSTASTSELVSTYEHDKIIAQHEGYRSVHRHPGLRMGFGQCNNYQGTDFFEIRAHRGIV